MPVAAHDEQFARLDDSQRRQQAGQERAKVFNFVGRRAQHDDSHRQSREFLLVRQIAVHGDEGIKPTPNQRKQLAI
jgi:hypothetical protein